MVGINYIPANKPGSFPSPTLCQEAQQEDLKKMKANKAKAMSASAKAIKTLIKSKEVKIPKVAATAQSTCLPHSPKVWETY